MPDDARLGDAVGRDGYAERIKRAAFGIVEAWAVVAGILAFTLGLGSGMAGPDQIPIWESLKILALTLLATIISAFIALAARKRRLNYDL